MEFSEGEGKKRTRRVGLKLTNAAVQSDATLKNQEQKQSSEIVRQIGVRKA